MAEKPYEHERRQESQVLEHIISINPRQIRLAELIAELTNGNSEEGSRRIDIEDAVHGLCGAGLLFQEGELLHPTRAAIRAHEVFTEMLADL